MHYSNATLKTTEVAAEGALTGRLPNFLYIGTSKAGSTWIYNVLDHHPDVYMAPGKGLYQFDSHYDYGPQWYRSYFESAKDELIVGEVSHSYLFSQEACRRIAETNPRIKLMVCLRNLVERAFSSYLDRIKNGKAQGSFEELIESDPLIINRGKYATHLLPYVEQFGTDQIHVAVFDELVKDPQQFATKIFRFLQVKEIPLPPEKTRKLMPAGKPRSQLMVKLLKRASHLAGRIGLRRLRGKAKTSRLVRHALYRPYSKTNKPKMRPETEAMLKERFRPEIVELDSLLGTNFCELWGY